MRKLYVPLVALILIASFILAGCGDKPSAPTTSPTILTPTKSAPTTSPTILTPTKSAPTTSPPTTAPTATQPSGQKKYGGTLTFISDMVPTGIGWPPELFGAAASVQVCLENLLTERPGPKYEAVLAESYEIHPENKYIDFKIRKGVKFHDGSDLTAEVVRWNYQIRMDAHGMGTDNWEKVEVIGGDTVRFHLKVWQNFALRGFCSPYIVSKAAYEKNGIEWMRWHPVGTGPFKFVSYEEKTAFKAERFDNYWQEGKPYLDAVVHLYVTDVTTQKIAMQSGVGDFLSCELGKVPADMKALGFEVLTQVACVFTLMTDSVNADSPYADKRVRMALEYAIDKEAIAEGLGYGFWEAPYQIIPRDHPAWDPNYKGGTRKYNPAKAKQLLAEAGYPDGFKTVLTPNPSSMDRNVAVAVQSYLKAVGIDAQLEYVEMAKFIEFAFGGWNNRILMDTAAANPNYLYTLDMLFSPEYKLLRSLKRPESFVQMFKNAVASPEIDLQAIRDICYNLVEEEAAVIPVYEGGKGVAYNDYVKDCEFLEFGDPYTYSFQDAWLDK
jgi:peptide/nickel transport system substrate-binding protein